MLQAVARVPLPGSNITGGGALLQRHTDSTQVHDPQLLGHTSLLCRRNRKYAA